MISSKKSGNTLTALLLEDYISDAELISHYLREKFPDCIIHHVQNGEQFLKYLKDKNPDIILSDYNIPNYSAEKAYEEIKKKDSNIPFIVLSGEVPDNKLANLVEKGIDDYLLKSSLSRIGIAVNKAIQKKNSEKRIANYTKEKEQREKYITDILTHSGISVCELEISLEVEMKFNYFSNNYHDYEKLKNLIKKLKVVYVNDNLLDLLEFETTEQFKNSITSVFSEENLIHLSSLILKTKIGEATNNVQLELISGLKNKRYVKLNLIKRKNTKSLSLILSFIDETAQRESEIRTSKLLERMENTIQKSTSELTEINNLLNVKAEEYQEINHKLNYNFNQTKDSLIVAKQIQNLILPKLHELKTAFTDAFAIYKPKDIVSGDFYWMGTYDNNLWLASADCTGHGVPGAMMSMTGNHLLSEIISSYGHLKPSVILEKLDLEVSNRLKQREAANKVSVGMDITLCKFNLSENFLEFSGALQDLYFKREQQIQITKGTRRSIGGIHDQSNILFENHEIHFQKGDKFYFTSDGFQDQFGGPKGKKFMKKRFVQTLEELTGSSMKSEEEEILSIFNNWKMNEEQVDDVIVLGIEI